MIQVRRHRVSVWHEPDYPGAYQYAAPFALGMTRGPCPPGEWDDPTWLPVELDVELAEDLSALYTPARKRKTPRLSPAEATRRRVAGKAAARARRAEERAAAAAAELVETAADVARATGADPELVRSILAHLEARP